MTKLLRFPTDAEKTFKRLEQLWDFVDSTISKQTISTNNDLRLLVLASITTATHRLIRGVIAQIKNLYIDGVDILTRSLAEGLINVKYIIEDETQMRARAYIVADHIDRINSLKRLISLLEQKKAPGMATVTDAERYKMLKSQLETELLGFKNQYGEDNLVWPNLEQRARMSNSEELYATVIWLLSLDSHLTARGLDRFMKEKEDGGVIIDLGQDLSRISLHLTTIYITYMALLNECSTRLDIPLKKDLEQFDNLQVPLSNGS